MHPTRDPTATAAVRTQNRYYYRTRYVVQQYTVVRGRHNADAIVDEAKSRLDDGDVQR